jgi:hypothetical protein
MMNVGSGARRECILGTEPSAVRRSPRRLIGSSVVHWRLVLWRATAGDQNKKRPRINGLLAEINIIWSRTHSIDGNYDVGFSGAKSATA